MKSKVDSIGGARSAQPPGAAVTPPLPLPHERDESAEAPGPPRQVVKQAAKDLSAGMVDTDNYTRAKAVSEGAEVAGAAGGKRSRRLPPGQSS